MIRKPQRSEMYLIDQMRTSEDECKRAHFDKHQRAVLAWRRRGFWKRLGDRLAGRTAPTFKPLPPR